MRLRQYTQCNLCPLYNGDNRIVWGRGEEVSPDLFFILEYPADEEPFNNLAFSSRANDMVIKSVNELSKQMNRPITWYCTYLTSCRIRSKALSHTEIACCSLRLEKEIELIKPKAIIGLGATVAKNFFGMDFSRNLGNPLKKYGVNAYITYHPKFLLMKENFSNYQTFIDHLVMALGEDPSDEEVPYKVISSSDEGIKILQEMEETQVLSCLDIETYLHLSPFWGEICWVGIDTGEVSLFPHLLFKEIANKIDWSRVPITVHNYDMEWPWVKKHYGIELSNLHDTLVMYHLIDERTGKFVKKSLKALTEAYLGKSDWGGPVAPYIKDNMNRCPPELLHPYLAKDVRYGRLLYFELEKELKKYEMLNYYNTHIRPQMQFLSQVSYEGVKLDYYYALKLRFELTEEKDEIKKNCPIDLNLDSPKQLAKYLYDDLSLPQMNKRSTDFETLLELKKHCNIEFLDYILRYREISKTLSTFVEGIMEVSDPDRRVHTKFDLAGTSTGRLSSKDPGLHNIPSRKTSIIKNMFIPEEGMLWLDCDYKQLELVVGAHMSNDENLIADINSGKDLHSEMAALIFEIPLESVTKEQRAVGKSGNFGVMYLMNEQEAYYNFKQIPGMSKELAARIVQTPRNKYQTLFNWTVKSVEKSLKTHYCETLFGLKRRFNLITEINIETLAKKISNMPIQGTASFINLNAAMRIKEELPEIKIKLLIHDSIQMCIPDESYVSKVVSIMEIPPFETLVKFKVDSKISNRWGSA